QTATMKLDPIDGSIKVSSEIVASRLSLKQTMETTLPLGVRVDLNDIPTFLRNPGATALPGGTVVITSVAGESLQILFDWQAGGRTVIRYDVSSDGNTMTVSVPPPDFARVVFERQ